MKFFGDLMVKVRNRYQFCSFTTCHLKSEFACFQNNLKQRIRMFHVVVDL